VTGTSRSFHIARMGVACPAADGKSDYVYDAQYFECLLSTSYPYDAKYGSSDQSYICIDGSACDGNGCAIVYEGNIVDASLNEFKYDCVEAAVPITEAPTTSPDDAFEFSSQFQATFGLLFDEFDGSKCKGSTPNVTITCKNGNITFLEAGSESTQCVEDGSSVLVCTDSGNTFIDQYANITYVSN
jgi:hypothetical protein